MAELPIKDVMKKYSFFELETVKQLDAMDFELDSENLIRLKFDNCILILFYSENKESQDLAIIWSLASREVSGPIFAAVNLLKEKKIAEAFSRIGTNKSHPLFSFRLRQIPFILVYRNSWPVVFYEGPRNVQAIINYALVVACNATFPKEIPIQTFAGTETEKTYTIPGINSFKKKTAEEIVAEGKGERIENLRGYPIEGGIININSPEAKTSEEKEKEFRERLRKIFEEEEEKTTPQS